MVKWTDIMAIAWRFILMNASCAENWFLIRKHQLILPLENSLRDFWPFQFHYMCSEFFTYGQKHNADKATINSYKKVKFLVVGKHFGQKLTALLWHYHCTPFARYPKESEIFNGWKMGFWWYIHDTCVEIDSGLQLINCINWSIHLKCIQTPLSYIWATILSRQKFLDSFRMHMQYWQYFYYVWCGFHTNCRKSLTQNTARAVLCPCFQSACTKLSFWYFQARRLLLDLPTKIS